MQCGAVMQGEVGGRGLVGMIFDDDKAGGKLEVRRAVVASAEGRWGMGMGMGGAGSLCSFFPGATKTRQLGPTKTTFGLTRLLCSGAWAAGLAHQRLSSTRTGTRRKIRVLSVRRDGGFINALFGNGRASQKKKKKDR